MILQNGDFEPLDHLTPAGDLEALVALADSAPRFGDGKIIVEVGSWAGSSALALMQVPDLDRLFCVDHWKGSPDRLGPIVQKLGWETVFQHFCKNMGAHLMRRVIPLVGTSEMWAKVWPFPVSMVFIDGNHDKCEEDIRLWLPHVCKGGILCGHDYDGFTAVNMAVDRLASGVITGQAFEVTIQGQVWATRVQ